MLKNVISTHYASMLLFCLFLKGLALPLAISESIVFGCLTILSGWQEYLNHIRMQDYHQKQIEELVKDVNNLKAVSLQIRDFSATLNNQKFTSESRGSWTGR